MRRFVLIAALAAAVLPFAADVAAKEMPTVQISSPPAKLRPHTVWCAKITYTIDGQPADMWGWFPYVQIQRVGSKAIRIFEARQTNQVGVFSVLVTFPRSGRWEYDVGDGTGLHDGAKGDVVLLGRHR